MEVADQRIAAPARPDLGEGDGAENAHGDIATVGVVEGEAGGMDRERAAGRDALLVQRVARRPAARRSFGAAVPVPADVGRGQLRRERQQPVGLQPAGLRPGGGERAFERPAEGAERGLRGRTGTRRTRRSAREAGGDEHPVVRQREGRAPAMQPPPAARRQQVAAALHHAGQCPPGAGARRGPGAACRAETRARPVDDLHRAALGRRVGQRARERPQGLGVDAGKRRQLKHEPRARGIDVELARFVEGAPGQQRVQRGRQRRRRPRARRLRTLEQLQQPRQRRHQRSLQPAGSSTTRTWLASR